MQSRRNQAPWADNPNSKGTEKAGTEKKKKKKRRFHDGNIFLKVEPDFPHSPYSGLRVSSFPFPFFP